jgi:tRNA A37 methylthiotransferase MiaB
MRRVHIKTLGCRVNEYDSGKMLEVLAATEGYSATDDPAEADKSECNRWVNFPGDARLIDQFVEVDVPQAMQNSYRGRMAVDRAEA